MVALYLNSPAHLYGVVLNAAQTQLYVFVASHRKQHGLILRPQAMCGYDIHVITEPE
jgi:hypothetical protein